MWGAVAGMVGRLFGSDTARNSLIEGTKDALDAMWYTNEEKAHDKAAAVERAQDMMIEWLKNTSGQNLSRRIIALSVTGMWLAQYGIAQFAYSISIFVDRPDQLEKLAAFLKASASDMDGAVMLILGFYFAAPYMGRLVDTAVDRFVTKGVIAWGQK